MQNNFYILYGKRFFDILATILGGLILLPIIIPIIIWIKLSSKGPLFYVQKRVGKNFKEFNLYKFRSMIINADKVGPSVTSGDDPRITKVGRIIRKTKIDELPQLINVIKGDMSLVGPRPEVMKFVKEKKDEYKNILTIKPGITDNAAIEFRDEETIMEQYIDKEKAYIDIVLPQKIKLYNKYITIKRYKVDIKNFKGYLMNLLDKRFLGVITTIVISIFSFFLVTFLLVKEFSLINLSIIIITRVIASFLLFDDYKLSWSKASTKTGLMKILLALASFMPILYFIFKINFNIMFIDLIFYTFIVNILVYVYKYYHTVGLQSKTKKLVIYGAGKAGLQLQREFLNTEYDVVCFIDDDEVLQHRSIDGISIYSKEKYCDIFVDKKFDKMVVAMPSASKEQIKVVYENMQKYFKTIKILPSIQNILKKEEFTKQLKDISVEDLLARHPKDLDKQKIENFIKNKVVLITGAGGSIGSEISRQCAKFGAKQLILLDHSEFNLYTITEELKADPKDTNVISVMQTVRNFGFIENTFAKYKPQIVIHAAAYKHVPLVEENILEGISNNIIGTKNCIDLSIKYEVEKFVLISTDKAVRPTNVMGTTKRICELYAQNVISNKTEIVAVRFGNVLGSVIPKFKLQIEAGKNITVTHPDITRYFMLIPEACELVLQAASIGKGGEIFILDMGEPIRIVDLAQKMIDLSGKTDIQIEFCGLRTGEKLYEELLIEDSDKKTDYESITVAGKTNYDIEKLNKDIEDLLFCENKLSKLKDIVPEFNHQVN